MELVYSSDFTDKGEWLVESNGEVAFEGGALRWTCDGASVMGTIWCLHHFEGPLQVEYDVTCIAGMNNMNFFLCADTENHDLLETTEQRTGIYAEYQAFPNYIITYLTDNTDPEGKTRVRFRKDPGFELLSEWFSEERLIQGRPMHVVMRLETGGRLSLTSDGVELHHAINLHPLPLSGYLGFRTWNSVLEYRNFRVYAL